MPPPFLHLWPFPHPPPFFQKPASTPVKLLNLIWWITILKSSSTNQLSPFNQIWMIKCWLKNYCQMITLIIRYTAFYIKIAFPCPSKVENSWFGFSCATLTILSLWSKGGNSKWKKKKLLKSCTSIKNIFDPEMHCFSLIRLNQIWSDWNSLVWFLPLAGSLPAVG